MKYPPMTGRLWLTRLSNTCEEVLRQLLGGTKKKITRQASTYKRTIRARSCHHYCSGDAISITYSECVFVTLCIQNAMRIRYIVICGLPRSTIFFHIISLTARFSKKKSDNIKYVFWFSVQQLSEKFLYLRRTERDMIKHVYRSSCKVGTAVAQWLRCCATNRKVAGSIPDGVIIGILHSHKILSIALWPWGRLSL